MASGYNWLQYFSIASLTKELQQAGFVIEDLYADVAGRPYQPHTTEMAVVARKAP